MRVSLSRSPICATLTVTGSVTLTDSPLYWQLVPAFVSRSNAARALKGIAGNFGDGSSKSRCRRCIRSSGECKIARRTTS